MKTDTSKCFYPLLKIAVYVTGIHFFFFSAFYSIIYLQVRFFHPLLIFCSPSFIVSLPVSHLVF